MVVKGENMVVDGAGKGVVHQQAHTSSRYGNTNTQK